MSKIVVTEERRQQIVDAAVSIIIENGLDGISMRKIAIRAGLSTGSIYHHFKNKEEVIFEVLHQTLHFSHKIVDLQQKKLKDDHEVLESVIQGVQERMSKPEEQRLYILLLSEIISKGGVLSTYYQERYEEIIKRTGELFQPAFDIQRNPFQSMIAGIFIASLDGMAIQQSLNVMSPEQDLYYRVFIDFFKASVPAFLSTYEGPEGWDANVDQNRK